MAQPTAELTIKRRVHVMMFYLTVILLYLLLGGVVMSFCERDEEAARKLLAEDEVARLNISEADKRLLERSGFCSFPTHDVLQWTTGGSIFYSLTVITTIGYGSFAPSTMWGQIFTVVYALVGLSVIGILLSNIAVVGHELFKSLVVRAQRARGGGGDDGAQQDARGHAHTAKQLFADPALSRRLHFNELKAVLMTTGGAGDGDWDEAREGAILEDLRRLYQDTDGMFSIESTIAAVVRWQAIQAARPSKTSQQVLLVTFVCCTVWVLGWSGVFSAVEGWIYSDSLWFSCITLSTIGFGDFVPVTDAGRVAAFAFIAPGIGMVASLLSCLTDMFENYRFWLLQRLFQKGLVSEKVLVAQGVKVCLHNEDDLHLMHSFSGDSILGRRDLPLSGGRTSLANLTTTPLLSPLGPGPGLGVNASREGGDSSGVSNIDNDNDNGDEAPDWGTRSRAGSNVPTRVGDGGARSRMGHPLANRRVRSVAGLATPEVANLRARSPDVLPPRNPSSALLPAGVAPEHSFTRDPPAPLRNLSLDESTTSLLNSRSVVRNTSLLTGGIPNATLLAAAGRTKGDEESLVAL